MALPDDVRAHCAEVAAHARFVTIEEDVDRMIMQPGAAAGGALHASEIARLRAARGADLPRFHRAVLSHGPLNGPGLQAAVTLTP